MKYLISSEMNDVGFRGRFFDTAPFYVRLFDVALMY